MLTRIVAQPSITKTPLEDLWSFTYKFHHVCVTKYLLEIKGYISNLLEIKGQGGRAPPNFQHILSFCSLRGGVPNKILLLVWSQNIWPLPKLWLVMLLLGITHHDQKLVQY